MKRPAPDQFPPMPAVTLTDDVDGMCAPCVEGDHEDCTGWDMTDYTDEMYGGAPDECSRHWPVKIEDGVCPECEREWGARR